MYLGLSSSLKHSSPKEWAETHKALGLKSVVFPVDCNADENLIEAYKEEAEKHGLLIAEVGIWRNTLASDMAEREKWIDYAIRQLKMADKIGAACCVNVVGTPYGPRWDGGYRQNFSQELWQLAVKMIQRIIDEANPVRTKFSIESMPWMIPSSPDEYLRLIKDVNRKEFGAHLDVVNMITSPERYFFNDKFLEECFSKLKGKICSCHLKDIRLKEEYTFQLQECACGQGTLDLELFAKLATAENAQMPMIIEHLSTDEEYLASLKYVQKRLAAFCNG
ncbi:MAG: sugar phosphate isomerase/epimerase [Spirochaetaceae bacterium]|nr:sugar phosphate isomerase/epimerase [Spirochaetaceae bacterium]